MVNFWANKSLIFNALCFVEMSGEQEVLLIFKENFSDIQKFDYQRIKIKRCYGSQFRNSKVELKKIVFFKKLCSMWESLAGGRNVDDQNVDRPKISERRNGLFS